MTKIAWGSICESDVLFGNIPHLGPLGFLLALFWCKNGYNVLCHYSKNPFVLSFLLSCVAILLDRYVVNLPFAILPEIGALLFYALGDFVKQGGQNSLTFFMHTFL